MHETSTRMTVRQEDKTGACMTTTQACMTTQPCRTHDRTTQRLTAKRLTRKLAGSCMLRSKTLHTPQLKTMYRPRYTKQQGTRACDSKAQGAEHMGTSHRSVTQGLNLMRHHGRVLGCKGQVSRGERTVLCR
jgi:hypothetical protein